MTRPKTGVYRYRWLSPGAASFVAVLLTLVIGLNVSGMPLGGRWYEEDGSLCPIGADWPIPIDQMRFATPENGQASIEKARPGCIPDEGGQCHFVSFDSSSGSQHTSAAPSLAIPQPVLVVPVFRVVFPLATEEAPAYYAHGPPYLLRPAASRSAPLRAPPVCS